MAEIANAEFEAGKFVSTNPGGGIVAVVDGAAVVRTVVAWNTATGDVDYSAPAGTNALGGTRLHRFDGTVQVNTGTRAVPVYSDVITSAGGTITGTLGIGAAVAAGVHLLVSKASDAAGVGAPTIRLRNTLNSSGWTTTAPWAKLEAYSDDASTPGAAVRSFIGWRFAEAAGQSTIVDVHTSDGNNALYPVLSLDRGTATLSRFSNTAASGAQFIGRRALGTSAVPLMVSTGRLLASLEGHGYVTTGATYALGGSVRIESDGAWADGTSYPTRIVLSTVATSATTAVDRWQVGAFGHLVPNVDNASDFGGTSNRIRNMYVAGTLEVGSTITQNAGTANLGQNAAASGQVNVGATDSSSALVNLRVATGSRAQLTFRTGTALRWSVYKSETAEGGADSGSNFVIAAYDDAGVNIDLPMSIGRLATGAITFARPFIFSGSVVSPSSTVRYLSGNGGTLDLKFNVPTGGVHVWTVNGVQVGTMSSGTFNWIAGGVQALTLTANNAAGTLRDMNFSTAGVTRWTVRAESTAEGGADAGSNFNLIARTDAGVAIDVPINIVRAANGVMSFARPIQFNGINTAQSPFLMVQPTTSAVGGFSYITRIAGTQNATANGDTLVSLFISPSRSVGAFTGTTADGINIGNVTGAATNYAIRTGTGIVQFGDALRAGTDNSFDIGASSGSRFRDLWLGRNADIPGTLGIGGTVTHTGISANFGQSATTGTISVGTGTGSGLSQLQLRAAAGQARQVVFTSGATSVRWIIQVNATAEAGANAGSNYALLAYDDAGVNIDTPFFITRAAGGSVTLTRPIVQNSTSASLAQSTTNATVNVGSGTGANASSLAVRSAAGQFAILYFQTGTLSRWSIAKNTDAEGGANAGSPFYINAFDDAGVFIDTVLKIDRAAGGTFTVQRPATFSSGGIQVGAPAGGNKGTGTINVATDLYKANTAYTNPDYAVELWARGSVEKFAKNPGAAEYVDQLPRDDAGRPRRRTLAEYGAFMREHLHLPQIPDALGIFERADALLSVVEEHAGYLVDTGDTLAALANRLARIERHLGIA